MNRTVNAIRIIYYSSRIINEEEVVIQISLKIAKREEKGELPLSFCLAMTCASGSRISGTLGLAEGRWSQNVLAASASGLAGPQSRLQQ